MISLTINNTEITAEHGETILQAAEKLSIDIPTMCYLNDLNPFTSCMVCVVADTSADQLLPACSTPVANGMVIETDSDTVKKARKDTLDLLLSEHVGNCEAPCLRTCPAYMNIPLMIKQIKEEDFASAIRTVKKDIALPAVLGRICPAPCERGCNRKYHDTTLSICLLKRFVADVDLESGSPYQPAEKPASGKKVAIVGAGPAGLASAYYLAQEGHTCHIFDQNDEPGGLLKYGVSDEKLDKKVLYAEIDLIRAYDQIKFYMNHVLGTDSSIKELNDSYDAIIIATGTIVAETKGFEGLDGTKKGLMINRNTFETNMSGIFAGGNALAEGRMAIRSLAHGKFMAISVDQFLTNQPVTGYYRRFNSVIGRLAIEEAGELLQLASEINQIAPDDDHSDGLSASNAIQESTRCFRCDCRKPESCKLRIYADEYGANQHRFKTSKRKPLKLLTEHPDILFEPGKCIKCGLCVQISEKRGEELGFTFSNRGYDAQVIVPFQNSIKSISKSTALECVTACPTGALALRSHSEDKPHE